MDYNLLAEKLFPHIHKTPEDILRSTRPAICPRAPR